MKRLSKHTISILSLLLTMALAVTSALVSFSWPLERVEADTVTLQEVFTSSTTWTVPCGVTSVTVLVVAGGGGGGSTTISYYVAGGGGAGGLIYNPSYAVTPGASITVTVGGSGSAGSSGSQGGTGGNSVFGTITAHGGGGGGGSSSINGVSGGSGGGGMGRTILGAGSGAAGTAGEGKSGGNGKSMTLGGDNAGGGGGGNTTAGTAGASDKGGNGGAGGDYSAIFGAVGGASGKFAGGGGGGVADSGTIGSGGTGGGGNGGKYGNSDATPGTPNTGGGGGGAGKTSTGGGAGGTGFVVIKYTQTRWNLTTQTTSGGTVTTPGIGTYTYNQSCPSSPASIVATPSSSCYVFVNWTGTGVAAGKVADPNSASTTINMSANYSVQANFRCVCYNLTTSAGSGGTVTTPGVGTYTYINGAVVSINATNYSCYSFVNWTGTGAGSVNNVNAANTTITMNDNYSIQANFIYNCHNLTTSAGSGGTVTTPGVGTYQYTNGTVVNIVATPSSSCYVFVNWSGNTGTINDVNASSTTITMSINCSITANFRYNCYNLTTSAGSGGTVTAPGLGTYTYVNGTSVNIAAVSSSCYSFNNWSGDTGTIVNVISSSTLITMNGNYSIQANFAINTSVLSVSANNSGGVPYFDGSNPFTCGATVSIYANTSSGCVFAGWTPTDGIANASAANTTVLMNQTRSLTANYNVPITYTLTTTVAPADAISAGCTISTNTSNPHASGSFVLVTANTVFGWTFSGWSGDLSGSTNPATILINSNKTVSATFTQSAANPGENYTIVLSWHIAPGNFSFSEAGDSIVASMTAYSRDSMGKYVKKQLAIQIAQRTSTQSIWGDLPIYANEGLRLAGSYNLISGDVHVNGPVTVDKKPANNVIDGTLTCDAVSPDPMDPSSLAYNNLVTPCTDGPLPNIGVPQDYFKTDLSTAVDVFNDAIHEYVFTGSGNTNLESVSGVWKNNDSTTGILKDGMYYSNGTIIMNKVHVRGNVTFVATGITIHNTAGSGSTYADVIYLKPYYKDLLLWATGSKGTLNGLGNADIEVTGNNANTPCADLEGVIYAPNGELELAGSGAKYWNSATYVIFRATLDKGALLAKYITISGDYWSIYRW